MAQDRLERAFAELEALEKFRISYSGLYPSAPLAHEDPDVRRLVEAMAMFTARTRLASDEHRPELRPRLSAALLLSLDPVPPMTMLRAMPTQRYVDVTELPLGTGVQLVERTTKASRRTHVSDANAGQTSHPSASTSRASTSSAPGSQLPHRDALRRRLSTERYLDELNLYVNHLDDLASSVTSSTP